MRLIRSSWGFGLLILVPIPALFFSTHIPAWGLWLALGWVLLLYLLRSLSVKRWLSHTPADMLLWGMLLLLPLGLWATPAPEITLSRTYALIANILLFYALAVQSENRALQWVGWGFLLGGLLFLAAVIPGTNFYPLQKMPFINRSFYDVLPAGLRLPGDDNGFNPNMTGGLLAMFLPPALALTWRSQHRMQRLLALITFLAISAGLLLTQSRGAILGALVALALVTALLSPKMRLAWWLIGIVGLALAAVKGNDLLQTFMTADASRSSVYSLAQRMELWERALNIGADFSFTGIGMGSFLEVLPLLYPTFLVTVTADVPHAHNLYLQTLVEMGIPGLLLSLAFYMILASVLVRRIRLNDGGNQVMAVGLLGSLVAFLVHGIVDVPSYSPLSAMVIWGMFGLMMAVGMERDRMPTQEVKA